MRRHGKGLLIEDIMIALSFRRSSIAMTMGNHTFDKKELL